MRSSSAGRTRRASAVPIVLALALFPGWVRAQTAVGVVASVPIPPVVVRDHGNVTMRAVRIDEPLALDGRLDEKIYKTVPPASDFVQQEPRQGAPATERTDVWVFFDGANVYAAVRCWDSQPERMVANDMRRDGNILQNENVTVTFDTFRDRRSGFYFQTSPLGAMRDALIIDQRIANFDWNGVWNVKSRRDEHGWTFELVVPFKTLRYPAGGEQVWGVNFRRMVRWKNETSFLSPVAASFAGRGAYIMSSSAALVGLEAPMQSRNIELKPYVTGGTLTDVRATPPRANDLTRDMGADFKYGLTRGLIADVTVNTDFAQVEADDQQVNLSRASLFFPEKREFFLEGQGVFTFAGATGGGGPGGGGGGGAGGGNAGSANLGDNAQSTSLTPVMFFSRRIGLDAGAAVPIRAGARVAGRAGHYQIGLLNIQTGETKRVASTEATNFSVVRVRRDLFARSSVGVIGTNRSPRVGGDGGNQLYGADLNLQLFQNVAITTYFAQSRANGATKDRNSYMGRFDYAGDRYGLQVERLSVDANFSPQVAFVPRPALQRSFAYGRFSPRFRAGAVRKVSWQSSFDYITDPNGRLQSRDARTSFRTDWNNGDQWFIEYMRLYERLSSTATFARATVAAGSYAFQEVRTVYNFGPPRRFFGRVEFNRGSYYDGDRTIAGISGRLNTGPRLGIEPRVSINWINVTSGKVVAKVISTRTTFTVTPRMFVAGLVQYNSTNATFSSNIRFRWEYIPGSDFFLIYSDGRDTRPIGHAPLDNRTVAMKFTRLVRW